MRIEIIVRAVLGVLIVAAGSAGCAWRTGASDHYVGPTFFRYNTPGDDRAAASEVVSVGMLVEIGRQWGASVGVLDRVTVAPRYMSGARPQDAAHHQRWSRPLSPLGAPVAERWNFSLIYARADGMDQALVARRLYGAQLVVGPESRAASVGVVSLTTVQPPGDAISVVHFDSAAPLQSRFSVWRAADDTSLPVADILKEADR